MQRTSSGTAEAEVGESGKTRPIWDENHAGGMKK